MKTRGQRLAHLLELRGVGVNAVDRAIGQGSGYTTRLARDLKKRPDADIVAKIADFLGANFVWLQWGVGPRDKEAGAESSGAVADALGTTNQQQIKLEFEANLEAARRYTVGNGVTESTVRVLRERGIAMTRTVPELVDDLIEVQHELLGKVVEKRRLKRGTEAEARRASDAAEQDAKAALTAKKRSTGT